MVLFLLFFTVGLQTNVYCTSFPEIYKVKLSTSNISIITDKVFQAALEGQNRPLDSLYIDPLDWIIFKVSENGKVINKTVYLCVGLNKNGLNEVLGMWVVKPKVFPSRQVL